MGRIKYAVLGLPENKEVEEAYFKKLRESGGFDLTGVEIPKGVPVVPGRADEAYLAVPLFARLGLHRYNMLQGENQGENWELGYIINFNQTRHYLSSFYITLTALDRAAGREMCFQVKVSVSDIRNLNCNCAIARPLDFETHPPLPTLKLADRFHVDTLPAWPQSEDAFSQFFEVKESELEKYSWIRLYLELVVGTGQDDDPDTVSQLKIVRAFIDPEPEQLNDVTVYIEYKNTYPYKLPRKGTNRTAIVRRFYRETTQQFVLLGKTETTFVPRKRSKTSVNVNERRVSTRSKTVNERRISTRIRNPIQRFGNTEAI